MLSIKTGITAGYIYINIFTLLLFSQMILEAPQDFFRAVSIE